MVWQRLKEFALPAHLAEEAAVCWEDDVEKQRIAGNPVRFPLLAAFDFYLRAIIRYQIYNLLDLRTDLDFDLIVWYIRYFPIHLIRSRFLNLQKYVRYLDYNIETRFCFLICDGHDKLARGILDWSSIFILAIKIMYLPVRHRVQLNVLLNELETAKMTPEERSCVAKAIDDLTSRQSIWPRLFEQTVPDPLLREILLKPFARRVAEGRFVESIAANIDDRKERRSVTLDFARDFHWSNSTGDPAVQALPLKHVASYMRFLGQSEDEDFLIERLEQDAPRWLLELLLEEPWLFERLCKKCGRNLSDCWPEDFPRTVVRQDEDAIYRSWPIRHLTPLDRRLVPNSLCAPSKPAEATESR